MLVGPALVSGKVENPCYPKLGPSAEHVVQVPDDTAGFLKWIAENLGTKRFDRFNVEEDGSIHVQNDYD